MSVDFCEFQVFPLATFCLNYPKAAYNSLWVCFGHFLIDLGVCTWIGSVVLAVEPFIPRRKLDAQTRQTWNCWVIFYHFLGLFCIFTGLRKFSLYDEQNVIQQQICPQNDFICVNQSYCNKANLGLQLVMNRPSRLCITVHNGFSILTKLLR